MIPLWGSMLGGAAPTLSLDFTSGALSPLINFSRASNATVTNSAGLITYAPMNLLTYSEQFDNAAWTKTTTTVTANSIAAPNGTTTADTLTAGGANSTTLHSYTAIAQPYTFSVYIRRRTGTGNIDITADGTTYTTVAVTSSWVRYSATVTPTAGTRTPGIRIVTSGDAIDVWGAQLEIGSTATTYNSTTVKNLLGYSELFDNAAWTKSNSFVQTNLIINSESFDNAAWTKTNSTVTANNAIAPNGYQTADTITDNATSGIHTFISNNATNRPSVTLGQIVTISAYVKAGTLNRCYLFSLQSGFGNKVGIFVDLSLGTITSSVSTLATPSNQTITSVGNGWYRVSFTYTAPATATYGIEIGLTDADGVTSYSGTGKTIQAWGAQFVLGAVAGDYRRTDAAALPVYYNGPFGYTGAEQIQATAANGTTLESYTATGGSMTFSIWLRRVSGTGNVDITMDSGTTWTTQTITSTWDRYSITSSPTAGSRTAGIRIVTSGDIVQVWGAQLSDSASLDTYVCNAAAAPSAAAYYGPRFDYDPVTKQPKGLLIEEQRSNLALYSEAFDTTSSWFANNSIVSANTSDTTSPSGTNTADKLTEQNTTNVHTIGQLNIIPDPQNTNTTVSVYAKSLGRFFSISQEWGANYARATFDLTNGTVTQTAAGGTGVYTGSTITPVGNGWYRCTLTGYIGTAGSDAIVFSLSDTSTFTGSQKNYAGDTSKGVYLWGAQCEAGAFATSYIPTAASSVTRSADIATIVGSNFLSWYNPLESTLFFNGESFGGNAQLTYSLGSIRGSANEFYSAFFSNGSYDWYLKNSAGGQTDISVSVVTTVTTGIPIKTIIGISPLAYKAAVNGVLDSSSGIAVNLTFSNATILYIGTATGATTINGHVKTFNYYNKRLDNAKLQGLTA